MSKICSLPEAVTAVQPGMHVALGGFAITRNVIAAVHELVRRELRNLTVSQCVGGMDTDLLVAGGCVKELIYSGGSLDRFGLLHAVNSAVLADRLKTYEYSSLSMTVRYHIAGLGMPFGAIRSLQGSDLAPPLLETGEVKQGNDPFSGDPVLLVSPLRPDVGIIHVDAADEAGNSSISGPTWNLREIAFASKSVVVLAEELVGAGQLPADRVTIPGAIVSAVAIVPRAAHPTAVFERYDYDAGHLRHYVDAAMGGAETLGRYLDRFVFGVSSHEEYLAEVEL